jgi:hypothetical protein
MSIWQEKTDDSSGIFTKSKKEKKTHVVDGKFKDKKERDSE